MLYVLKPPRKPTILGFMLRTAVVLLALFLLYQGVMWFSRNFNNLFTFNGVKLLLGGFVVVWLIMVGGFLVYSVLNRATKPK